MPRKSDAPSDPARRVAAIALGLLGLSTIVAGSSWLNERAITTSDAQIKTQELALARGDEISSAALANVSASSPPRLLLSDALYRARTLQHFKGSGRASALAELSHQVDLAINARPHWAQAWVVKAYIEAMQTGADHRNLSLVALSRSYSDAPFLRDAAGWRIMFSLAHWDDLDAFVRGRMIEEAIWLVRVDNGLRKTIFGAARDTSAYQPLILRWREMRLRDGTYLAAPVPRFDPH